MAKNLETLVFSISWHSSMPSHNFNWRLFWSWLILSFYDWPHKPLSCRKLMLSFNTLPQKSHRLVRQTAMSNTKHSSLRNPIFRYFSPLVTITIRTYISLGQSPPGKPAWPIPLPVRPGTWSAKHPEGSSWVQPS